MQFAISALDGRNMLEKRIEVRPRHLENMAKYREHVVCGGALLDEEGKMKGSLLIMNFDSREQVDEYLDNEPYIREEVWQWVKVEPMNVVIVNGEKAEL